MLKKYLSILLVFSISLSCTCPVRADGRGDSFDNVAVRYAKLLEGYEDAVYTGFCYRDEWFSGESGIYNHGLATMSFGLAMAGFGRAESPKDRNVRTLLADLNFNMDSYSSQGFEEGDGTDSAATALCLKSIPLEEGNGTLLAVALRSINYGKQGWASNFTVGDSTAGAYHRGFYNSADSVKKYITAYLNSHSDIDRASLRVWITGYSRSAPIAGILSEELAGAGLGLDKEDIFTYTFASANYETYAEGRNRSNAFHLCNPLDLLPQLPPYEWGFHRSGHSLVFPYAKRGVREDAHTSAVKEAYRDIIGEQGSIDPAMSDYDTNTCQKPFLAWLNNTIMSAIPDRNSYASDIQGLLISLLNGSAISLPSYASGVFDLDEFLDKFKSLGPLYDAGDEAALSHTLDSLIEDAGKALSLLKRFRPNSASYIHALTLALDIFKGARREVSMGCISLGKETPNLFILLSISGIDELEDTPCYLVKEHYPEVYLAHLLANSASDLKDENGFAGKTVIINGDMDIRIGDADGNTLLTVLNGDIDYRENCPVSAGIFGESDRVLFFPDGQNFSISLSSRNSGSFNYIVREELMANRVSRTVRIDSISCYKGQNYSGTLAGGQGTERDEYALNSGGSRILPTYDSDYVAVPGMQLSRSEVEIYKGGVLRLIPYNVSGNEIVFFESSDDGVAAVDDEGWVMGMNYGAAIITAYTVGRKQSASCTVTVRHPRYGETGENTVMLKGKVDISGLFPDISGKKRYISLNKKILSVSRKGIARGKGAGRAEVKLQKKGDGGWETVSSCNINVEAPRMVKKAEAGLSEKDLSAFAPTLWKSTNENVAKVDGNGRIRLLKAGRAKIIAVFGDGRESTGKYYATKLKVK